MHEFEIIKKYFSKLSLDNKNSLKLNDDVFFDKSKELVISVDTYIDKSHFFDFKDPDLVIKKILRSSISDLICKGVKPKYYFISGSGNKKSFTKSNTNSADLLISTCLLSIFVDIIFLCWCDFLDSVFNRALFLHFVGRRGKFLRGPRSLPLIVPRRFLAAPRDGT